MRGERFVAEAAGLYLDYSENRITDETLRLLLQLAKQLGLRQRIDAMFRGDEINVSEKRSVLPCRAARAQGRTITHEDQNVAPEVHAVLDRMSDCAERVRSGA